MRISTLKMIALGVIFTLFTGMQSFAQAQHIVGEGTIETNYPPNTQVFAYNWSSMLYTAEEMGDSKTITHIAYDQTTDYTGYWEYAVLDNQKIYMKMVDDSEFNTLAYEDPTNPSNGYTLVFDGTVQFNMSWSQIELIDNFEYDGTKSLIVHWENHRGETAPIVNVKFNASTVEEDVFKALGGDVSFPTAFGTYIFERPNLAVYYLSDGPANPANPTPANNSFKASLSSDLEFVIGENTTSYDVYFGTENPPVTLLVSDAPVSAAGTFSCNPSAILGDLLAPKTNYFWQVIAKSGDATAASEVWTFKTEGIITDFPYEYSFEDSIINIVYSDTIDWEWPHEGGANWRNITAHPHTGLYSAACNVWGDITGSYSLRSPRINLENNMRIGFWWRLYNGDGSEMDAFFEISTDGGENWTVLQEFEAEEPMDEYEQYYLDLGAAFAGNNTFVRWRYDALAPYIPDYFEIDDFFIEASPTGAVALIDEPLVDFSDIAVGTSTYLPIEVKNVGPTDLVITGSTLEAPFSINTPITIAPGNTGSIDIFVDADVAGEIDESFEFSGDFTGDASFTLTADVYQVDYNFFENGDASNDLPEFWNVIRTRDPYDFYTDVTVHSTNYDAYSAPNAFRMMKMNDTISPLMLFTKGVGGYDSNILRFYAKKSYDDYDATLEVGLSNDPLHADAFEVVESFEMTTTYQQFEVEFPNSSELPYIVFSFVGGRYASVIWLDDLEWDQMGTYPPYCPVQVFPANNADDVDVMMGLNLNWTSGGGNPTGYMVSIGTDASATNIIDSQDVGDVLNYTFPVTPEYGQEYFWKVIAYNAYGESTGCGVSSFTVMEDPVQMIPFAENFDGLDYFGDRDYPLGWSIENANNDNFPWDLISNTVTPGLAHTAPNAMHMLFALNPMDDYLFTPPLMMSGGSQYTLTFWHRTMGDSYVPYPVEKLKVFIGSDNTSTFIEEEIYSNPTLDNQEWEMAIVNFTAPASGEFYLSFYGHSDPNQGLLLIDDVEVSLLTGVNEFKSIINVYPNPAEDYVVINSSEEIRSIEIYDIQSRVVYRSEDSNMFSTINTSGFGNGTYFIRIYTADEVSTQKLIIK